MAQLSVVRISGVILITQSPATYPKYFSGASFVFQPSDDYTTISLTATEANGQVFQYTVAFGDLLVGSQGAPSTMDFALSWLTDALKPS